MYIKRIFESKIFKEFRPVDSYLDLIGACVGAATHIQNFRH